MPRFRETPVGVEPTCCCFAGSRLAVWLQRRMKSVLARNRTWSSTFAESRANPPHSEDNSLSIPTWSRTRTRTLGGSCAFRYTIGTEEPTAGFAPA